MSTIERRAGRKTDRGACGGWSRLFVGAGVRPARRRRRRQALLVAAGDEKALAICEPLLRRCGTTHLQGGRGADKMANAISCGGNFMIMAAIESLAEAMTLAAKNGVEKSVLLDGADQHPVRRAGLSHLWRHHPARALRARRLRAPLGLKDMNLADAAAVASRVPMPFLAVLRSQLLTTIARHGEKVDWSALAKVVAENSGL